MAHHVCNYVCAYTSFGVGSFAFCIQIRAWGTHFSGGPFCVLHNALVGSVVGLRMHEITCANNGTYIICMRNACVFVRACVCDFYQTLHRRRRCRRRPLERNLFGISFSEHTYVCSECVRVCSCVCVCVIFECVRLFAARMCIGGQCIRRVLALEIGMLLS